MNEFIENRTFISNGRKDSVEIKIRINYMLLADIKKAKQNS